jgi:hypothetical protein
MSCDAKFPADISLSCVFGLIAEARNGITPATAKKALWVAGCLFEKIAPATVPPQAEVQSLEEVTLDDLLDALEAECQALEAAFYRSSPGTLAAPVAGTQGWEVILPMILQLVMFIIEQRQKKKKEEQQPAPAPTPAPASSIGKSGSGTVPAPKKS